MALNSIQRIIIMKLKKNWIIWLNFYKRLHDFVTVLQHWVVMTRVPSRWRYYSIVSHAPKLLSGEICRWVKYLHFLKAPILSGHHNPVLHSKVKLKNLLLRLFHVRMEILLGLTLQTSCAISQVQKVSRQKFKQFSPITTRLCLIFGVSSIISVINSQ